MILLLAIARGAGGCGAGGGPDIPLDTSTDGLDTVDSVDTATDFPTDDGPTACTSHAMCDDGVACTNDLCTVAGTCSHTPDDDLCGPGEHCALTGCISGCTGDPDCDDGQWCNGVEHCYGTTCVPDTSPRDCNDGNSCTSDWCDEDLDTCHHDPGPDCEADAPADITGEPFDPSVHYSGIFDTVPEVAQECIALNYHISQMTFSSGGSTLTVQASPFTLSGALPGSPDFSVTGISGCMSVTLSGSFTNSDNFVATWQETKVGTCAYCTPQTKTVAGIRH